MRQLTTDIYEGAYLLSHGMVLENIWMDRNNPRRSVIFEFKGKKMEILRRHYQKGEANVNIVELKAHLNELKDRMFSLLREEKMTLSHMGTGQERRRDEIHRKRVVRA